MKSLRVKLADFGVSTLLAGQDGATEQKQPPRAALTATPTPPASRLLSPAAAAEEVAWDDETMTPNPDAAVATAAVTDDLAEGLTGDAHQLTQAGILVGTPMYMAPELSEGSHHARPPSDVFSLGMIAFELFSGELPFARPPVWARWRGKDAAAPSLADKRPDLAAAVVAVIDSCLQLDPALRPSAEVVAAALRPHVDPAFCL